MTSLEDYGEEKNEDRFFPSLAKQILEPDSDAHQLEKWDPDPPQNVLDPPHCLTVLFIVHSYYIHIFVKCPNDALWSTVAKYLF